ncbi:MAG TPA: DUF3667 domain-containing protein [Rhizomicrobium sp.]|nr:DUF3667 domain-containing protein [Rhizomicrobium sp.]
MEAILESGAALGVEYAAARLAEQGKPLGNCANCGAPLVGPYCAMCGQEPDIHRRSVVSLAHDLFEDIASFDSRILRTAKALLFQPGELPLAFHEGRTRRYVPALRLYFFVSLVFFLILGGFNIAIMQLQVVATPVKVLFDAHGNAFIRNPAYDPDDPDQRRLPKLIPIPKERANRPGGLHRFSTVPYFFQPIGKTPSGLTPQLRAQLENSRAATRREIQGTGKDSRQAAERKKVGSWIETHLYGGLERLAANPAALNEPLTTWIPRVLFLLLPLYALLLALFYWRQRKKFYLIDHLIFSLTAHTFTFVALIIAVGLAQLVSGGLVFWFLLGSIGLYVFFSLRRFYRQSWFWTAVKFLCISGVYTSFFLLPALGSVIVYGFLYS